MTDHPPIPSAADVERLEADLQRRLADIRVASALGGFESDEARTVYGRFLIEHGETLVAILTEQARLQEENQRLAKEHEAEQILLAAMAGEKVEFSRVYSVINLAKLIADRAARAERKADLEAALRALAERHEWTPDAGPCMCSAHEAARKLLGGKDTPPEPPRLSEQPEVCICAAVRKRDGRIYRGHRHHHCLSAAAADSPENAGSEQGFITSRNRFVSRREGRQLQEAAGVASVAPGGYRGDLLFSEDLY